MSAEKPLKAARLQAELQAAQYSDFLSVLIVSLNILIALKTFGIL